MKAIILVGGQGTRLMPLTARVPKNIVPLCNVPFLTYPVLQLKRAGVKDIVFSVSYKAAQIRRVCGDGRRWGVRIRYALEREPLGTAGAVKNAERLVAGHPVFVLNGDILSDLDLGRMRDFHREKRSVVTVALARVKDPAAYGLVLTDRRRRVTRFLEKPGPRQIVDNAINAGAYLFEPDVFGFIPPGVVYSTERALFPNLLEEGVPFHGYLWKGYWRDIGTCAKYLESHRDVLDGRFPVHAKVRRDGDGVYWGRGVRKGKGVVVRGPSLVGGGCVLEDGARIGPYTVLGERCRVGRESVVSGSLLWDGTATGRGSVLRGVILGLGARLRDQARFGPGTVRVGPTRGARS